MYSEQNKYVYKTKLFSILLCFYYLDMFQVYITIETHHTKLIKEMILQHAINEYYIEIINNIYHAPHRI